MFFIRGHAGNSQVEKDNVWRRIFRNHPAALDLFLVGNELLLNMARQRNQRLNNAILTYGIPSRELLNQIICSAPEGSHHSSWASVETMPFIEEHRLQEAELRAFCSEGYVHCRDAVPLELIALAKRHINASLGRGRGERKQGMVGLPDSISSAEPILNLFRGHGSKLSTIVQSLTGRSKCRPPNHAQVALRYPAPYTGSEADSQRCDILGKHWHIDGFGQGKHSPFTLLVGVCLSECTSTGSGNFAVHPGAHWHLQENVKTQVARKSVDFSNFEFDENSSKPDLGKPVELLMRPGDCVVAHQKLPHLGMPNCSPDVRYQVYFRLQHVNHEAIVDAWLDDLLLPFEPVKAICGM